MSDELRKVLAERNALDQSYLEQIKANILSKVRIIELQTEVENLKQEISLLRPIDIQDSCNIQEL